MRTNLFCSKLSRFGAAALAVCQLAACGMPTQSALPFSKPLASQSTALQARMRVSGCSKSIVYVTSYNNSVYVYDQKHNNATPCGQITGVTNPQGLFVDNKRNLWVALSGNCRTVYSSILKFAGGDSKPIETLQDPGGPATGVAVDNKSGTVYVTNFFSYSEGCASGNPGAVEVYANGSTSPTSTLTSSNMEFAFSDAVDDAGNLYVTYARPGGGGGVLEWSRGSGSPKDLGISLQYPAGIQTTKNGALLICDQVAGCGDFEPGSTKMTHTFATETPGSYGVALDRREKNAWVEDPILSGAQLERYKYPGPDKQAKQAIAVPGTGYAGVALSPASPQGRPY